MRSVSSLAFLFPVYVSSLSLQRLIRWCCTSFDVAPRLMVVVVVVVVATLLIFYKKAQKMPPRCSAVCGRGLLLACSCFCCTSFDVAPREEEGGSGCPKDMAFWLENFAQPLVLRVLSSAIT